MLSELKFLAICFTCLLNIRIAQSEECLAHWFGTNNSIGVCTEVSECRGAALQGSCLLPQLCCFNDTGSDSQSKLITKDLFLKIAGNTSRNGWLYGHFVESLGLAQIKDDPYRAAAYLSQVIGETDYFKSIESPVKEKDTDPNIGNTVPGDGSLYRGRGGILLRGKKNYQLATNNSGITDRDGLTVNFTLSPELAAFPSYAFKLSAWFWTQNAFVITSTSLGTKQSLNKLVDGTFFNFSMLTHSLTDNLQSLKKRANVNELILNELNNVTLKRGQGIVCSLNNDGNLNETGYAVPICLADFKKSYCGCEGKYKPTSCPYGKNSEGKCRNSALVKCCVEKCRATLDLVILTDSSGSITLPNFKIIREFVRQLVLNLPIGYNETRVSIINYSDYADVLVNLDEGTDRQHLLDVIGNIPYLGRATYTDEALKEANEQVLVESNGMRPVSDGVPKIVMVITDGYSTEPVATKKQAQKIKDRKFNIISVGIAGANIDELNNMASSPNDVYYVSEFNKVLQIITSLSRTTCLQSAEIPSRTEIKAAVEKDTYKYFKLDLFKNTTNSTDLYLDEFTFELKLIAGKTELFYSFEDENPKSPSEYLNDASNQIDENFIDSTSSRINRMLEANLAWFEFKSAEDNSSSSVNYEKVLYPVKRPASGQNEVVYFSVKGLNDENEFQVYIYEEYIEQPNKPAPLNSNNMLTIVLIVVFALFAIVLAVGSFCAARHFKKKKSNKEKPIEFK